jgi:hypothetical protein
MEYYNNGLTVRNGRLINERGCDNCMAPITQAAIMRKEMKREQKIEMMSEAMYRAEMRAEMREQMMDMMSKK